MSSRNTGDRGHSMAVAVTGSPEGISKLEEQTRREMKQMRHENCTKPKKIEKIMRNLYTSLFSKGADPY
jgi:hypothetical protein